MGSDAYGECIFESVNFNTLRSDEYGEAVDDDIDTTMDMPHVWGGAWRA